LSHELMALPTRLRTVDLGIKTVKAIGAMIA